nr:MAG TPA: hypothetical protein [Caudoviricetes sp.]
MERPLRLALSAMASRIPSGKRSMNLSYSRTGFSDISTSKFS